LRTTPGQANTTPTRFRMNPYPGTLYSTQQLRFERSRATTVHAIYGVHRMANTHHVYILVNKRDPNRHDTGLTRDLDKRLAAHNAGQVPHPAKFRPWILETSITFLDQRKARNFEHYLKSHSGRAFASKHF
jgi:predicted GIY-YIG superfamily endonuclease